MVKKVGFLLLSLFVVFGFGVSFANPIAPGSIVEEDHYIKLDYSLVCKKLENVEIDNYRAIILVNGSRSDFLAGLSNSNGEWEFYTPKANVCIKKGGIVFLLDKSIKIKNLTIDDVIYAGIISTSTCTSNCDKIDTYRIAKEKNIYDIKHVSTLQVEERGEFSNKFLIARLMTVAIETLILFIIAKLFQKEEKITSGKLILFGILPTTITLPLLWFVLPLLLGEGMRYTIIGEILITIIEAIIIKYGLKISRGKALIASIVCNVASYGLGLLIL